MELAGKKIAFLGDSITEGCGTTDISMAFWNVLARNTGALSFGYGIGGTRIAPNRFPSVEEKFDRWYGSRVEEMIEDADIVVVFGGTNDYGHGDACLGSPDDRDENSFYGSMHVLCRKLLERYPGRTIVFMTPLHRLGDRDCTYNEMGIRRQTDLEGYVNIIQAVCGYYSIPVLDLFRASGLQPEIPWQQEHYMPDGLHPNDAGHAIIAHCLENFLKAM